VLQLKNVIENDAHNEYNIIGFLDNDRKLQGKKISGIPVMDPGNFQGIYLRANVKTMIFAIKNIAASDKAEIYKFAVDLGLEVLEIPGVTTGLTVGSSWIS
jgi:FlaA1/EpsC-like NDP-sugar epimerase